MAFSGTQQKCKVCDKTVYVVDQLMADGAAYHKSCFRCNHCKGTLKVCFRIAESAFPFFRFCFCFFPFLKPCYIWRECGCFLWYSFLYIDSNGIEKGFLHVSSMLRHREKWLIAMSVVYTEDHYPGFDSYFTINVLYGSRSPLLLAVLPLWVCFVLPETPF